MSIYKGFGGNGHPVLNERRYEELCEAYADAKERVQELESENDELKSEIEEKDKTIKRLKEQNIRLDDSYRGIKKENEKLRLKLEDYNYSGSDLLVDLMVSYYDSEAMHKFEKCFDEDELNNMKIERDYQLALMLKDEEDE